MKFFVIFFLLSNSIIFSQSINNELYEIDTIFLDSILIKVPKGKIFKAKTKKKSFQLSIKGLNSIYCKTHSPKKNVFLQGIKLKFNNQSFNSNTYSVEVQLMHFNNNKFKPLSSKLYAYINDRIGTEKILDFSSQDIELEDESFFIVVKFIPFELDNTDEIFNITAIQSKKNDNIYYWFKNKLIPISEKFNFVLDYELIYK